MLINRSKDQKPSWHVTCNFFNIYKAHPVWSSPPYSPKKGIGGWYCIALMQHFLRTHLITWVINLRQLWKMSVERGFCQMLGRVRFLQFNHCIWSFSIFSHHFCSWRTFLTVLVWLFLWMHLSFCNCWYLNMPIGSSVWASLHYLLV